MQRSIWQSHIDELHRSVADPNSGALVYGRRAGVGPGFEAGVGGHGLGEAGKAYRLQLGPRVAEP